MAFLDRSVRSFFLWEFVKSFGLALRYCSGAPALYELRDNFCMLAGEMIMDLISKNIRPRDIVTRRALENAAAHQRVRRQGVGTVLAAVDQEDVQPVPGQQVRRPTIPQPDPYHASCLRLAVCQVKEILVFRDDNSRILTGLPPALSIRL